MSNNEKNFKPNTRVVYSADITKEYIARKNDPAYADCLEELEREYKFHMLNHEISLLKGDDSYSKEKILNLRIDSGLYPDSDVKKFLAQKKQLKSKTPSLKSVKIFSIGKAFGFAIWFLIVCAIVVNAIKTIPFFDNSSLPIINAIHSSSSSIQNDKEFFGNLSGSHKVDYALKNISSEDKLAYAYDKLSNDSDFKNLSQEEKDSKVQNFYKNLDNDQKLDFINYFSNKYFK